MAATGEVEPVWKRMQRLDDLEQFALDLQEEELVEDEVEDDEGDDRIALSDLLEDMDL